ncbi:MAG: DUF3422 domain-containing protein [Sneathiellales bacterium]|nr:DUF3422 domain-containing protein [Sneathiellales bacterium]
MSENTTPQKICAGVELHPLRYDLNNELHARPFEQLEGPVQATMYAMFDAENTCGEQHAHVAELCRRYGLHPPAENSNHFAADFGKFRMRWERYSEFTAYTFFRSGQSETPFQRRACEDVPEDWLSQLPGQLLTAVKVELLGKDQKAPTDEELDRLFVSDSLVSSEIGAEAARLWTDLRIDKDGFNRSLIQNYMMPPRKAGRLILRVFEIAIYRNLSLLALPLAREISPRTAMINQELADLTEQLSLDNSQKEDAVLLRKLTQLSAEIETLSSKTAYRFSATRAYYAIIQARIQELRESHVEPYQTVEEFLERRLAPAMRTCQSVSDRLADLSRRATRSANLMRTKTDFTLAEQNQTQLTSMNKRAQQQLRLQETVEGLSVAAISYYLVSLIGYAAVSIKNLGVPLNSDLVKGVAIPLTLLAVWYGLRRFKRALSREG